MHVLELMTATTPKKTTAELKIPAKKRRTWLFICALLVAVAGMIAWWLFSPKQNPHLLFVSGRTEGYETRLSPKIGGRVAFIKYREGDSVEKNELVAQLNDADFRAQLAGAKARILQAQAAVKQQLNQIETVRAQVAAADERLMQSREQAAASIGQGASGLEEARARYKQARADLEQTRADFELATIRLNRYTELVTKGAVTKDEYDNVRTNYNNILALLDSRQANELAADKAVRTARAVLAQDTAQRLTPPQRSSELSAQESQLQAAYKQLEQAQHEESNAVAKQNEIQANLDYLTIISPIHGVVTARPVEPGAVLSPGQTILTVLDYGRVYMRAFVPEASIAKVRIGQKAYVYLDAMPKRPFSAKVIEIDPEGSFTPENIYFKDDRVKQVFGIKLGLDNPAGYAKPGMPADANIEID